MNLLTVSSDAKTKKGEASGYLTGILYLLPHTLGGGYNLCPSSTPECRTVCLNTAGRLAMAASHKAKERRTKLFLEDRAMFMTMLRGDIAAVRQKAHSKGLTPCFRLNGTSDISWENVKIDVMNIMESEPGVQFYDYTKVWHRMRRWLEGKMPANYHLTFSRSEQNRRDAQAVLRSGGNVAVVFRGGLPEEWDGHRVISGDDNDLRFLDPSPVIVGLTAKGKARRLGDGFVVETGREVASE